MTNTQNFDGASVLVLGGTGSLGSRIAGCLAAEGANVTVAGRSETDARSIASEINGAASAFDFRDNNTIFQPVRTAIGAYGALDGVVNAAGVVAFGRLADTPDDVVENLVAVNLTGPMLLLAHALPQMNGGFVANITGSVALMPTAGMVPYSATKGGLSAATIALAREMRRDRVKVIDAQPPHTETGLVNRALSGRAPDLPAGLGPDYVARRVVEGIAAGQRTLPPSWFEAGADDLD
ncbi:MAG: SDR family NAD(P)-dependent oxidoreductase [Acidimicrobiia bacterium]